MIVPAAKWTCVGHKPARSGLASWLVEVEPVPVAEFMRRFEYKTC